MNIFELEVILYENLNFCGKYFLRKYFLILLKFGFFNFFFVILFLNIIIKIREV